MRFEQEELRAKKALMLEAIRQGGPQLLSVVGFELQGTKRPASKSSQCSDFDGVLDNAGQDIDEALDHHQKQWSMAPGPGISSVFKELFHVRKLFSIRRGSGYAFSTGDTAGVFEVEKTGMLVTKPAGRRRRQIS